MRRFVEVIRNRSGTRRIRSWETEWWYIVTEGSGEPVKRLHCLNELALRAMCW